MKQWMLRRSVLVVKTFFTRGQRGQLWDTTRHCSRSTHAVYSCIFFFWLLMNTFFADNFYPGRKADHQDRQVGRICGEERPGRRGQGRFRRRLLLRREHQADRRPFVDLHSGLCRRWRGARLRLLLPLPGFQVNDETPINALNFGKCYTKILNLYYHRDL